MLSSFNNNTNIQNINKYVDYKDCSWIINSYFNYKFPKDSILNVAYPSAIAFYYITILPPNSDISIYGHFLNKHVFEISITFYDYNGDVNENYNTFNTYKNNGFIYLNIKNKELLYIIQRFYVNLDWYSNKDIVNNLFSIYDNKNHKLLPTASLANRTINSLKITDIYRNIIQHNSLKTSKYFSKFFLPLSSGLFPSDNHLYIISSPGRFKCLKISGTFKYSDDIPYCDFITVNQDTTATDDGIPFYKFNYLNYIDGYYELYVVDEKYEHLIDNYNNIPVIKWNNDNDYKGVIFRIINYNYDSNIQSYGPLTPEQTKSVMISGFYPDIEPIF